MSFEATLIIEDDRFTVLEFNHSTSRSHDRTGRATSQLSGIRIEVLLRHKPECVKLHLWAYLNSQMKSGAIEFMRRDNFQKQTELKFKDSYIVEIGTNFENEGKEPMTERLVIYANEVEYISQGFSAINVMEWPG